MEMQRLKQNQQDQLARVEKACLLPTPHVVETRIQEIQCDLQHLQNPLHFETQRRFFEEDIENENDNTGLVVINNHNDSSILGCNDDILEYARHPLLKERESELQSQQVYINQLKLNYEAELERQQQVFEGQLITKQQTTVRIFEELLILEFDKILQSIFLKDQA